MSFQTIFPSLVLGHPVLCSGGRLVWSPFMHGETIIQCLDRFTQLVNMLVGMKPRVS